MEFLSILADLPVTPMDLQFLLRVEEVHEALLQIETIPLFFFNNFLKILQQPKCTVNISST